MRFYFPVSGEVQEMKLCSNCLGYGPRLEPTDEVEQHLTLTKDGNVKFSDYCYGTGEKYQKVDSKSFKIASEKSINLLTRIQDYFSNEYDTSFATDVGSWDLILTNTEGKTYRFHGSLCPLGDTLIELSELYHQNLDMPELFMFDGQEMQDKIDKFFEAIYQLHKLAAQLNRDSLIQLLG